LTLKGQAIQLGRSNFYIFQPLVFQPTPPACVSRPPSLCTITPLSVCWWEIKILLLKHFIHSARFYHKSFIKVSYPHGNTPISHPTMAPKG